MLPELALIRQVNSARAHGWNVSVYVQQDLDITKDTLTLGKWGVSVQIVSPYTLERIECVGRHYTSCADVYKAAARLLADVLLNQGV